MLTPEDNLFEDDFLEQDNVDNTEIVDSYNEKLLKKRDNLNNGNFNVLPFPFKRASYYFPGLEKPTYVNVSAETKVGKTSLATAVFILEPLWEAYRNPKLKVWYHYCNLEESEDRIKDRIVSWLLYRYTNGIIRIGYRDLNSATVPLSDTVITVLENPDFIKLRDFFFSRISFNDNAFPTGISIGIRKFVEKHGTIIRGDEFTAENNITGKKATYKTIKSYKQHDDNEFLNILLDNFNNVTPESGQTLLQAITKVSKELKDVRNKFNCNIIALQQLSAEGDTNDAFKQGRVEPRITNLADAKQTGRDLNCAISIFSPTMKFEGLEATDPRRHGYKGYNLDIFGNYFRTMNFMVDRDGGSGLSFPMYFDGKVDVWEELPLPNDTEGLQVFYDRLELIKQQEEQDKQYKEEYKRTKFHSVNFFMFIKEFNNKIVKSKVFKYLCNPFSLINN